MNELPRKNAATTRGRPFAPGNRGRPQGSRHKATLAIEALLEGEHEALTRKAVEKALEGDVTALRLCLDRLAPPRKDSPVTIELPAVKSAEDTVEASSVLLAAVAAGEITPGEASTMMSLLVAHRGIIEMGELERRIAALEDRK
jgi:hypothetical protein